MYHGYLLCLLPTFVICTVAAASRACDDIVLADFEYDNYGDWVVTGQTFGTGPADTAQ